MVMWRSANGPRTANHPQIGPHDPEQKLRMARTVKWCGYGIGVNRDYDYEFFIIKII